jgi:hypothetical protein
MKALSTWGLFLVITVTASLQVNCSADDGLPKTHIAPPKSNKPIEKPSPGQDVGEPGQVAVSGAGGVTLEEKILKLDIRIVASRSVGNACVDDDILKPGSGPSKATILQSEIGKTAAKSLENIENNEYYINLGCNGLKGTSIQGLKLNQLQLNSNKELIGTARKVFICGKVALASQTLRLVADEVYLVDIALSQEKTKGEIEVTVNSLALQGQNKISTKADKDPGTSVFLNIAKKTYSGEKASLTISTQGGDCSKKTKDVEPTL